MDKLWRRSSRVHRSSFFLVPSAAAADPTRDCGPPVVDEKGRNDRAHAAAPAPSYGIKVYAAAAAAAAAEAEAEASGIIAIRFNLANEPRLRGSAD